MSNLENCRAALDHIADTLQTETALLKEGRVDALPQISIRKADAMKSLDLAFSQLNTQDERLAVVSQVLQVKRLSQENGLILKSLVNGVKAAQARLESIKHSKAKVGTYNRNGRRLLLSEDQIISEKHI